MAADEKEIAVKEIARVLEGMSADEQRQVLAYLDRFSDPAYVAQETLKKAREVKLRSRVGALEGELNRLMKYPTQNAARMRELKQELSPLWAEMDKLK